MSPRVRLIVGAAVVLALIAAAILYMRYRDGQAAQTALTGPVDRPTTGIAGAAAAAGGTSRHKVDRPGDAETRRAIEAKL